MLIVQQALGRLGRHSRIVLPGLKRRAGISAPCVKSGQRPIYDKAPCRPGISQSGAGRFAFVALLLLALPAVLTFHTLLALPRLAERRRTFWYSLHPHIMRPEPLGVCFMPCADEVAHFNCAV